MTVKEFKERVLSDVDYYYYYKNKLVKYNEEFESKEIENFGFDIDYNTEAILVLLYIKD